MPSPIQIAPQSHAAPPRAKAPAPSSPEGSEKTSEFESALRSARRTARRNEPRDEESAPASTDRPKTESQDATSNATDEGETATPPTDDAAPIMDEAQQEEQETDRPAPIICMQAAMQTDAGAVVTPVAPVTVGEVTTKDASSAETETPEKTLLSGTNTRIASGQAQVGKLAPEHSAAVHTKSPSNADEAATALAQVANAAGDESDEPVGQADTSAAVVQALPSGDAETMSDDQPNQHDEGPKNAPATVRVVAQARGDVPLDEASATKSPAAQPSAHTAPPQHAVLPVDLTPAPQVQQTPHATPPQPPPMPLTPHGFAEVNHPQIVTSVRGELLPNGGSMQIRLDPPELGALQVTVRMQDGAMVASFETSNESATRLLSHSLNQLKHALESQGVTVEKLQVQQSPRDAHAQNEDPRQQQQRQDDHPARQEQQRREMLRRMWRRLALGDDPLDLVA